MAKETTFTGTLSILFSDLRDYTAFVEKYGDAAGAALITEYRRLVRAEVAKAGGGEMNTAGDSFYIVFPTARQALQAGMGILREAERYSRERPDRPLRVGIGIHAGEPIPHEGQHVGSAVNIAARLAQQAAAGELLVSEVVRQLLRTSGMPPMRERDRLVLKGIQDAPRVYAVVRPEWKAEARTTPASTEVAIPAEPRQDRRILCPELIGRERELASLEVLLKEAVAGRGRTALLSGEAGLGKTAALRAFAERVRAEGARVLVGECTEIEARRPFGPFIEMARAIARDPERASSADTSELLGLTAQRSDLTPELAGETERYRAHAAFARLIADLAQDRALVVAVEDLQWADDATLELFPYLARKLREDSVLLLGTYRSDELHRRHPLNHLLAELARGRLADEVPLRRLTLEETGSVIRAALGLERPPTPEFRAALQERCEGNPFFIEEVLRALVEQGDLSYRDGAWRRTKDVLALAIPVSILDAVQQRMRRLPPDGQRVMHVAAVIGPRFEFDLLRRVTGLSNSELLAALRAAIDAQLIGEEAAPNGEEHYVFRHALTRESVVAELLQREGRLLHQAVGEAIEAIAGTELADRAEELAYHFDQARDQGRALRYHELAAREAVSIFAFARAAQHLERAVELASDDDPSLGELQLRLADAAFQASDIQRACRAAEEARGLFEKAGDAHRSGASMRRLSQYRWQLGETNTASELAAEAIRILEPLGASAELAAAYGERARLLMLDERTAEAIEWGQRAIDMARRTDALEALVMALNTVGTAMTRKDPAGLALLRESLELALRHDLVWHAQRAYSNLTPTMVQLGAPAAELRRIHAEMVEHGRRFDFRSDNLLYRLCSYAFNDGDWDQALHLVEEGRGNTIFSAGRELWGEALILTARVGPEKGRPLMDGPRRRLLAAGEAQRVAEAAFSVALLLIADDLRAALDHAEAEAELVAHDYWVPPASLAAVCAIYAARALRDEAASGRWIEFGLGQEQESLPHAVRAKKLFARAERSASEGDLDAAIAMLDESARYFLESFVGNLAAHWVRLRRAELLLQRGGPGDREAAQAEFESVLPYWRKAKAIWYLGKLKDWAAEHGLRFPDG